MTDVDAVRTKVGEMDLSISLLVIQVTLMGGKPAPLPWT